MEKGCVEGDDIRIDQLIFSGGMGDNIFSRSFPHRSPFLLSGPPLSFPFSPLSLIPRQIIFSRFGRVTACDVIRDAKTGASLNYAFIGFEVKESAEAAYLKVGATRSLHHVEGEDTL